MRKVYTDRAGNSLYRSGKYILAKNAKGKMVNRAGVDTLIRRANRARGKVFIHKVRRRR